MTDHGRINSTKMKWINTRNVLNTIRREVSISRKDLSIKTGLTTGTITNITAELLGKQYLIEVGNGESEGGRKPILLELDANAGYAIGLELQVTDIVCVISDFKAQVLYSERMSIDVADGKNVIIDQMIGLVEKVIREVRVEKEKILGLGLAIPGPCDYEKGIMINPPNFPGWINVPIKDIFEKRLGLQVYTSKETSCAVLSEYWFGKAAGNKRIFGIILGEVGIGGALVLDGEIFQEKEGESMDIGHTIVQIDGHQCSCGNRGCLEVQANGHAAVRYAQESISNAEKCMLKSPIEYANMIEKANAGEPACVEAIKKCAFYISVAVGNVLSLLSPQRMVFGGDFIEKCPMLYDKIVEYIERRDYPASAKDAQKGKFSFGEKSGAMGGLALVFDAFSKSKFNIDFRITDK